MVRKKKNSVNRDEVRRFLSVLKLFVSVQKRKKTKSILNLGCLFTSGQACNIRADRGGIAL